jgi:hypothetical protein
MGKVLRFFAVHLIVLIAYQSSFGQVDILFASSPQQRPIRPSAVLEKIQVISRKSGVEKVALHITLESRTGEPLTMLSSMMCQSTFDHPLLFPDTYTLSVVIYNGTEFDQIIKKSLFQFNVVPDNIIPISPITSSSGESWPQFCFTVPETLFGLKATVTVWENIPENGFVLAQEQLPLFEVSTTTPCVNWPLRFTEKVLENGYLWQVRVVQGGIIVATSPISRFKVPEEHQETKDDYRLLKISMNSGSYLFGSALRFSFDNRYNESILNYKLTDITTGKAVKKTKTISLKDGINLIEVDLVGMAGMIYNHDYMFEVVDHNNDHYRFTFSLKKK